MTFLVGSTVINFIKSVCSYAIKCIFCIITRTSFKSKSIYCIIFHHTIKLQKGFNINDLPFKSFLSPFLKKGIPIFGLSEIFTCFWQKIHDKVLFSTKISNVLLFCVCVFFFSKKVIRKNVCLQCFVFIEAILHVRLSI